MPLGQFGSAPSAQATPQELADAFARLQKEVQYLLNGGLDTLNVNELSADVINAGVLNALLVVIKAANGGKSFQLDQNGITANNGSVDTLKYDLATGLLTIVSALIQSATGYPRVELNSQSNLFAAFQSAGNAIRIIPTYGSGNPSILFDEAGATQGTMDLTSGTVSVATLGTTDLNLQAAGNLRLSSLGGLKIDGTTAYSGTFNVVTSVDFVNGLYSSKTVTVKKGMITSVI